MQIDHKVTYASWAFHSVQSIIPYILKTRFRAMKFQPIIIAIISLAFGVDDIFIAHLTRFIDKKRPDEVDERGVVKS
jgi:hypothetical protein